MKILTIMSVKSSINKVSSIRVLFFFYFPYIYKNRVLACFQTRPSNSWHFITETLAPNLLNSLTFYRKSVIILSNFIVSNMW